jgi:lysophospholipase L1-like esterase
MLKLKWQIAKLLRLFTFIVLVFEVLLRLFSAFMLSPRHLTHGMPFFIDLKAGIFQWQGNWGIHSVPHPVPGQTYRVPLTHGEVAFARINNAGFRGEDFAIQKNPGVTRIATLGASSTFGFGNRDNETYPFQLEKILAQACPQHTKFEVYNFGIPFINSSGIANLYTDTVASYKPDLVTFYEGVNDTGNGPTSTLDSIWSKLRSFSLTAEFLNVPLRDWLTSYNRTEVDSGVEEIAQSYIANLMSIAQKCSEQGCLFLPATQQAKSYIIETDKIKGITYQQEYDEVNRLLDSQHIGTWALLFMRHHEIMRHLREWAAHNSINLVDVQKALDTNRQYMTSWVHLNKEGNTIIANTFADEIKRIFCPQ